MKIHLANFKEDACVQVEHRYDPKKLDLEFVDLIYQTPVCLEGTVEKGHETLTFRGHLKSQVEHICGRCLKPVKDDVDQPFELFYEIKGLEDIETTDDLREILILNHPISFLCRENCQGLCPQCGINRNEQKCHCEESSRPSRLGSLKQVWQKMKEGKRNG